MSKLSQRELLSEGFLSTVRKLAGNTVGAIGGGIYNATKQVVKDVAAADTSASIFNVAKQGAKGMASGWNTVSKWQSTSSPEKFVEEELKQSSYNEIFDPKSIKIIEAQRDTEVKRDLSQGIKPKTIKGNRFFVYFEALKYNETSGTSITQVGGFNKIKGVATVIKGGDGKFKLIEVKDDKGQKIDKPTRVRRTQAQTPTQPAASKPKFYEALRDWKINNIGPNAVNNDLSYQQLRSFLTSIGIDDANTVLVLQNAGITGSGAQTIPNSKLANLEASLKMIGITEKSQLNLLKQLNLLNDSYNKTYELSKH